MNQYVRMEPAIWQRLPEELLEHVLSLLPLKTFLMLRPTSKHFRSLLFSPTFISGHSPNTTLFSFLVLSHPQFGVTCPLFDTSRSVWRTLPLSTTSAPPSSTLTAISGGRLCFSHPTTSSFIICNLFQKSTEVVKSPNYPSKSESVTFISGSGSSYKLLLLSGSGSGSGSGSARTRTATVYDSKTRGWTRFDGFDESLYNQEGVWFNGKLYFITPEPFRVVSFDIQTGAWAELPARSEPFAFLRLASGGEKLYLIGGIGRNGISRSVKVWEMAAGGRERWSEIQKLPEMMFRKLAAVCYHKYEHVYCFWHQGLVCVCCYTWPEILYFKVSRGTWHWLPKCPLLLDKWSCGFRWFSFVPCLSALAS